MQQQFDAVNNKEQNRFVLVNDLETGRSIANEQKQMQHEMLPTMKTELIQVSYHIEMGILHDGFMTNN